ncbi:MAG TPA: peroxiredoxin [Candidatus Binataceae bacterium]|nr:peroxiredoxin [Candidatus Binataceae bacterium]
MLKAGDAAPDFILPGDDGAQVELSSLRGRRIFLWFFPEADTPGCSLEGRGLRDHREYFDQSAIEVIGISFDSVADNAAFARKYNFGFRLLSDITHAVALAYGACDSLKARHPERISFLIDASGRIERVYDRVDPRDHAAQVLAGVLGE